MKNIGIESIAVVLLCGVVAALISGCSFKVEALYHGKTPVGVDDRKSTAMTAAEYRPVRTVKVNRAGSSIDED